MPARTDRTNRAPTGYRYVGPASYAESMDLRERREAEVRGQVQAFFDKLRSHLRTVVASSSPEDLKKLAASLKRHGATDRRALLEKKQDEENLEDLVDEDVPADEDPVDAVDPSSWDQQFNDAAAGWVQSSYDAAAGDMNEDLPDDGTDDLPDEAAAGDDGEPSDAAFGRAAFLGLAVAGLWNSLGDGLDDADPTDPQSALDAVDSSMDGLDSTVDIVAADAGIGASNQGSLYAASNSSLTLVKQWFSAQDDLVRPSHVDLDGETADLDEPFGADDGDLMYPGDPDGPVGEVINCRCTLLYLTPEGEETGEETDTGEAPPEPDITADLETAGLLLHLETQAFLQREAKLAELDLHAAVGLYPHDTELKYSPDQPRAANGQFGDVDSGTVKDHQSGLITHHDAAGTVTHSAVREGAKGTAGAWSVIDHRTGAKVTGIGSKAAAVKVLKDVTGTSKVVGSSKSPATTGGKAAEVKAPIFDPAARPNASETYDKTQALFLAPPKDGSAGLGKDQAVKREVADGISQRMGAAYDVTGGLVVGRYVGMGSTYSTSYDRVNAIPAIAEDRAKGGGSVGYGGYNVTQEAYDKMSAAERDIARSDLGVRELVGRWAGTSNDKSPISLAMQDAAKDEFGLGKTRNWNQGGSSLKNATASEYQARGDMYRSFLRAQFDETQKQLSDRGITEMRLYRGFKSKIPSGGGSGTAVDVALRPMSSYSYKQDTAKSFSGYGSKGWVAATTVPAERILSTARSGFGCLHENEVVVLGGKELHMTWLPAQTGGYGTYAHYGGTTSGPEFKYSEDQPRDEHGRFGSGGGDEDRRHEYSTSTNTVDPRTGEKMTKTALGDAGEKAFETVVGRDLHTVTGSHELDNLNRDAAVRNVPLDFRSGKVGIEVKTISVDSKSQKAAISGEERQRKLDELPKIGADRAITVVQRYDPQAGSLEVRYHEGISSKSFSTATPVGTYQVGDLLR